MGQHEMPQSRATYFYTARDGGQPEEEPRTCTPLRDGGHGQNNNGENRQTNAQASTTTHQERQTKQTPNARASRKKGHAVLNPRTMA